MCDIAHETIGFRMRILSLPPSSPFMLRMDRMRRNTAQRQFTPRRQVRMIRTGLQIIATDLLPTQKRSQAPRPVTDGLAERSKPVAGGLGHGLGGSVFGEFAGLLFRTAALMVVLVVVTVWLFVVVIGSCILLIWVELMLPFV